MLRFRDLRVEVWGPGFRLLNLADVREVRRVQEHHDVQHLQTRKYNSLGKIPDWKKNMTDNEVIIIQSSANKGIVLTLLNYNNSMSSHNFVQ